MHVAVVFGGPSVEHDVSIITAQQVMAVLDQSHEVVPVYVAPDGAFWTGDALRDVASFAAQPPKDARPIELRLGTRTPFVEPASGRFAKDRPVAVDVVVNAIHGTGGEDGKLLGALELSGVPYVGRGVAAAAVAMDKHLAKAVVAAAGIEVLPHELVARSRWEQDPEGVKAAARAQGATVVVKPATLGSSIGVARVETDDDDALTDALDLALELDRQAVIEPFAAGATELNVAVVGRPDGELLVSEVERPLGGEELLSFEDKYLRGGGGGKGGGAKGSGGGAKGAGGGGAKDGGSMAAQDRVIPADVPDAWRDAVKDAAQRAHRALRLAGVVRYDFFVLDDGARVCLNEPNTVPGSFAFYLFEAIGVTFPQLLDRLLQIAVEEQREERSTTRSFESSLLGLHIPS